MKRFLMPASALAAMKKVAFAILACALLMLVAAPARADICANATPPAPAPCDVTIIINGGPGNLSAVITDLGTNYTSGSGDDKLIGIQNSSSVKVGAIILRGASTGGGNLAVFDFSDSDGACPACGSGGYQGPNNTFVGISGDLTTGKVLFTTPLAANGGNTWFSLEGAIDNTPVAIGENQPLTQGTTAIFKFGPGNPEVSLAPGSEDDYKFTPVDGGTGDSLTVTPVSVPAWGPPGPPLNLTNPITGPFSNLACVPYYDYSTHNEASTCVELEMDCIPGSELGCNFQFTTQLDYGVYGPGVASGNLIARPTLLIHHDVSCPDTGFTGDITSAYTGATAGAVTSPDPPPIKGGTKPPHSCLVSAYDPSITSGPQLIANGQTVGFPGFENPVVNTLSPSCLFQRNPLILPVNCIVVGLPVFLSWDQSDTSGKRITNLKLCKTTSCPTGGTNPPWVNLSLTVLTPSAVNPACQALKTASLPSLFNSGLLNFGNGEYTFIWNTLTNPKNLTGCEVLVVLNFSGTPAAPAAFLYFN